MPDPIELNAASEAVVGPIRESLRAAEKIRSLRYPDAEATPPSSVLPALAARQGKILGFDDDGAPIARSLVIENIELGSDATGDLYYRNASGDLTRLPVGTAGQVLKVTDGIPSWADEEGGGGGTVFGEIEYAPRETTNDTPIFFLVDNAGSGPSNWLVLPNNSVLRAEGLVVARSSTGVIWTCHFQAALKRGANAASTESVDSVKNILRDTDASLWNIALLAEETEGALAVQIQGALSTTIKWSCSVKYLIHTF